MGDDNSNGGALASHIEARKDLLVSDGGGMAPRNLGEAMEFARLIANSQMVPKDYLGKPGNVLVAVQMGAEIGLPPMQAIQNIAVINGRGALWGDALLAVVMGHHAFESIEEMDHVDIEKAKAATCVIKRKGSPAHTATFSVDDAKRAGLWGKSGPWTQYPSRMLQLRARAFACRNVFPDALRGIQSAEEVRDIAPQEHVQVDSKPALADRLKARKHAPVVEGEHEPEMTSTWQQPMQKPEYDPETGEEIPPEAGR